MNKEATQELMMGAVLVLLAYAAYRHFSQAKPPSIAAPTTPRPTTSGGAGGGKTNMPNLAPTAPWAQPAAAPSPFTSLANLLTGTTHDIGGFQGTNYLNTIAEPMLGGGIGGRESLRTGIVRDFQIEP